MVQKMSLVSLVEPPNLSKSVSRNGKFRCLLRSLLINNARYVYCELQFSMTRENRRAQWKVHGENNTHRDGSGWRNREHFWGTKNKCHFTPQFSPFCLGLVQEFLSKVDVICRIWLYHCKKTNLHSSNTPSPWHWTCGSALSPYRPFGLLWLASCQCPPPGVAGSLLLFGTFPHLPQ